MNAYQVNLFYQVELLKSLKDKKKHFEYIRQTCIVLSNKNENELGEYLRQFTTDPYLQIAVEHPVSNKKGAITEIDMGKYVKKAKLAIIPSINQFVEVAPDTSIEKEFSNIDSDGHLHCKYDWADNFTIGIARVVKDDRWGVIDINGNEVVPLEYDSIHKFGSHSALLHCVKNGKKVHFRIRDLRENKLEDRSVGSVITESKHYDDFIGSYAQDVMGYDDETINDAFEGDPEAYWNID